MPLELFSFGIASTLERLGPEVELRDVPRSPDGGTIADYRGAIGDPAALAARLEADPGVAAHGLFPPAMVQRRLHRPRRRGRSDARLRAHRVQVEAGRAMKGCPA